MIGHKTLLVLTACAALLLAPAAALAGDANYVALRGGAGWAPDVDRTAGPYTATIEYETPYSFSAAYGRRVTDWLRLEGEFAYAALDVSEIKISSGRDAVESGGEKFYMFMFNALADIHNSTAVTPFVGAGAGAVYCHHDVTFDPRPGGFVLESDSKKWAFGGQLMAGVAWQATPGVTVEAMYRFVGVSGRDHDQENGNYAEVDVDPAYLHLLMVGVRFSF